jgi:pimeloyl-ACP methyl ester carboxylesterase
MPHLWRISGRKRIRSVVRFLALALAAIALLLAATGAAYESLAEYYGRQTFPQQGRRVEVGTFSLNLDCSGDGSPTVILDGGVGEPAREWALVQPGIAAFTRVCSYDRAGYGWSDPGPRPRTSARIAGELHTLLGRAGIAPPYVLVGHSLGGLNVRFYASQYPDEVAGMVLVDASHPDQEARGLRPHVSPLAVLDPLLLRLGILRAFFLLDGRPRLPPRLHDELEYLMLQRKAIEANFDETRNFSQSADEVRGRGDLGSKPLVVVTAAYFSPRRPAIHDLWIRELQPDLLRLSRHSRQIMAASGHSIPLQQPDLVVQAVREVLASLAGGSPARSTGPLSGGRNGP